MTKVAFAETTTDIPRVVRSCDTWQHLAPILDEHGLRPAVGRRRAHWFVQVAIGRNVRKHFFSAASGDSRAAKNSAAGLRKVIRECLEAS